MATSIASQLQAIRSAIQTDWDPQRRPITRPSILFDPKEAADIDIDAILNIALSGLEVLVSVDERFKNYNSDLFSLKTKELDRELLREEDNERINATITSYLRLLSPHLQLSASLKTLEYLICRYKVHVYNTEELILCTLPYHDTHVFVQIIRLLDTRNGKWKFLEGVKVSGAPPPRHVVVQQCVRDMGVLEALCNYASPTKKFQPSRLIISFCTAVIVEVLGSLATVDSDVVKRILPFVVSGLQPGTKGGSDHKAAALMIVGLLANKVALSPKLVKSLIRTIAQIAREDAELTDLQWLRVSVISLINLVQSQSVDAVPKKSLEILMETRDIAVVLFELSKGFNIDGFLTVLLESLVDCSFSDHVCCVGLISIIETVPMKNLVGGMVSKVLSSCMRMLQRKGKSVLSQSGSWANKILVVFIKNYPSELQQAIQKFLEDMKFGSANNDAVFEMLSMILGEKLDSSMTFSDSTLWFALNHPKAEVRRATMLGLRTFGDLKTVCVNSQGLVNIQDAILRQLHDDDLTVIQAALSLEGLGEIINPSDFLKALDDVLKRCVSTVGSSSSNETNLACDVAISFLRIATSIFNDQIDYSKRLAAMMFPLLLILPKTRRLNLKVLELAKEVKWPFYSHLSGVSVPETMLQCEAISAVNLEIVNGLAEALSMHPDEHMPWLVERIRDFDVSKTLLFLVLMQSLLQSSNKNEHFSTLFEASFTVLKDEWEGLRSTADISVNELNTKMLQWDCGRVIKELFATDIKSLNSTILICISWRLLGVLSSILETDIKVGHGGKWVCSRLQDLFIFFVTTQSRHVFKEHVLHLLTKCLISPINFLTDFFTDEDFPIGVQVECLHWLAFLYDQSEPDDALLCPANIPSLLVPLAGDNQDLRIGAMRCIEGLCELSHRMDSLKKKNGKHTNWSNFVGEFLDLIVEQKQLILSDKKFLPSFLASLLGSSSGSLLVPRDAAQRFEQTTKEEILAFILGYGLQLPSFAKLMILHLLKGLGNRIMPIEGVSSLLSQLLDRQSHYFDLDKSSLKLSKTEVKILTLLLEICATPSESYEGNAYDVYLLKALQLDMLSSEESAIVEPCVTVLQKLTAQFYSGLTAEKQELLFREIVFMFRCSNGDIQNATQQALLRLNITCSTVVHTLDFFMQESPIIGSSFSKKKKKRIVLQSSKLDHDRLCKGETGLFLLSSLLDILMLKKDIESRESLIGPLFKLLGKIFSDEWVQAHHVTLNHDSSDNSITVPTTICYIQQTLFLILEDIISALVNASPLKDDLSNKMDVKMLIMCAHSSKDEVIRNHVFLLLCSIAKVVPEKILEHMLDILTILGESTVTQIDSYSQHVFEELIAAIVPCWLAKTDDTEKLLKVFVDALPEVSEHRKLSIVVYLLRNLGEHKSLASLLVLLFRSLASRKVPSHFDDTSTADILAAPSKNDWEYAFAMQICEQYSCMIWLPAVVMLLELIGTGNPCQEMFTELLFAVEFILHKLQDPEFTFKLESSEDLDDIQRTLQELVEHVVSLLQLTDVKRIKISIPVRIRRELNERMHTVLRTATTAMIPSTYFRVIISLLVHSDGNVQRKALGLLGETLRERESMKSKLKGRTGLNANPSADWLHMDENSVESFQDMCLEVIHLLDDKMDESDPSLKLSALSTLEVLALTFSSNYSVFSMCLPSVAKCISSPNMAVSSSSIQAAGALINILGPRALAELPQIMQNVIEKSHEISAVPSTTEESLMHSVLVILEAAVDKLGQFLNPYLEDIIRLMVLAREYMSGSNLKLKLKADGVRRLLTEKIPIRLALPPLLKIYLDAVESGDSSVAITFEMLANLIRTMDRPSVLAYHEKIFDLCLHALDLRHQCPTSLENIDVVEKSIINSIIALTMKLTETMFKPLFIKSIEWVESHVEEISTKDNTSVDRTISFFGLVNKLADNHRSLFVPYFKYLLDHCVRHLTDTAEPKGSGLIRKKKKAKFQEVGGEVKEKNSVLSLKRWHLRSLVISALHKCFLHDTGNLKFLDSSTFQVLLKPIVSQLVVEPPASLEEHPSIPSVEEVDEMLVLCVGQMAVTAGTDLLWKPLNHEVLMQTRSDKTRSRMLGLRIVNYLLDKLKEEYLVFLPETIPFLGELLEDMELPVKSLTQDILKEMESMSGESLRQYLV